MKLAIKSLFQTYLNQLETIVEKIPSELFSKALSEDMFSLEMNAKIAANFLLRGYYPLLGQEPVSLMNEESGKTAVIEQIQKIRSLLMTLEDVTDLDDRQILTEKAGFANIQLPAPQFIHQYIVPNVLFHMSMVYAVARREGVALSKGDFDGLHAYPEGFSFNTSP